MEPLVAGGAPRPLRQPRPAASSTMRSPGSGVGVGSGPSRPDRPPPAAILHHYRLRIEDYVAEARRHPLFELRPGWRRGSLGARFAIVQALWGTSDPWTIRQRQPSGARVLFVAASAALGGQPMVGLGMFAVMALWSGFLVVFGDRSETVGALGGRRRTSDWPPSTSWQPPSPGPSPSSSRSSASVGYRTSPDGNKFAVVAAAGGIAYPRCAPLGSAGADSPTAREPQRPPIPPGVPSWRIT